MSAKRIMLHVCCGPCSTTAIERLLQQSYEVSLFFSNSNIYPYEEYLKRMEVVQNIAAIKHLELVVDSYDHEAWLTSIHGLEHEPERGKRCIKCFEYNLNRAATSAQKLCIPGFATTLTVSRHKSSSVIFDVGSKIPGFIAMNFKKKDGYNRSIQLSSELNLYRQGYCGCEFSY